MLVSLLLAFFLLCVGMGVVFMIYVWLLWYTSSPSSSSNAVQLQSTVTDDDQKGLSELELTKLPCATAMDEDMLTGTECAVCLDEIEIGQPVRLLPGCNHHGFHLQCADAWLSMNPVCPLCRTKLQFPPHHSPHHHQQPLTTTSPESLC